MNQGKLVFSAIALVFAAIAASTFLHRATLQDVSPEDTGQKNVSIFDSNGSCRNCNLVFISLNILRADHVGAYGYFRNTTPNIDALAKESALFEKAYAQSGWTLPSYVSIMTSLYPHVHGVENRTLALSGQALTLAEILKIHGYRTAAFTSGNADVGHETGLAQGFETYDDGKSEELKFRVASWRNVLRSLRFRVASGRKWLEENDTYKQPFFLFLESSRLHCPYGSYDYRNPFIQQNYAGQLNDSITNAFCDVDYDAINLTSEDAAYLNGIYDWALATEDKAVGDAVAMLGELGVLNKTIIVFFSPHGDELYERGNVGHFTLYDTSIRVPLIIKTPQSQGGRKTKELMQLIDVMPTTLDLLGIPINRQAQGKSAAAFVKGTGDWSDNEYVFSEQIFVSRAEAKKIFHQWAVRTREWKYIQGDSSGELYDLQADPAERTNVLEGNSKIASELNDIYEKWQDETLPLALPKQTHPVSEEIKNILVKYGYP